MLDSLVSYNWIFANVAIAFLTVGSGYMARQNYDSEIRPRLRSACNGYLGPPGYAFGPIWLILQGFMAASIIIWGLYNEAFINTTLFNWTFFLYLGHAFFKAVWFPVFFADFRDRGSRIASSVIAFLLWGSAIAILVFFIIADVVNAWPIVFWSIYVLWLTYAFVLNVYIANLDFEESSDENDTLMKEIKVFSPM